MGFFTRSIADDLWIALVRQDFLRASAVVNQLHDACLSGSRERQVEAIDKALMELPTVLATLNGADPSSGTAKAVKKTFKKAVNEGFDAAKQGQTFFRDLLGGPGERAANETGFARRAAVARLSFTDSMMKSLSEAADEKMRRLSSFFGGIG